MSTVRLKASSPGRAPLVWTVLPVIRLGRPQVVLAGVEAARALPQPPREAGPPDSVAPVRVEVPARAAAPVPDARPQPLVGLAVELVVDLRAHLDGPQAALVHLAQA